MHAVAPSQGVAAAAAAAMLVCWAGTILADDAVDRGQDLYRIYCRTCHGDSGRGDGPTATELDVRPPDLTRLASGNGGEFPTERIYDVIDGRSEIPRHGREMPIWGFAFQELDVDVDQERQVRTRIRQLIRYLESIQRKKRARSASSPAGS